LACGPTGWCTGRATALAPISGAYDFQHAEIPALLSGQLHPKLSVACTAYLLVAFDRASGPAVA
jgi:hypothetical protein